jgi:contactin associated protein-like 2
MFSPFFTYCQDCDIFPEVPLGVTDKYNGVKDSQMTASSAYTNDTLAIYGRLHYSDAFLWDYDLPGAGAWVAYDQNMQQYLQVDLTERRVIKSIGTQGRQGARQWVTDYYVYYSDSDSAKQWTVYKDNYGEPFLFPGNKDDNSVHINTLKHPIVARYVRIMPQRWNNLIALRLELFGCKYVPAKGYFDGNTRIDYRLDLPNRATQTIKDKISMRFRTSDSQGLILYGDDGQGDYISIQIYQARLRVEISLGKPLSMQYPTDNQIDAGSLLDDNQWHDVLIERDEKIINITVDRIETWRNISAEFVHLNLNRNLSLGGLPNFNGRNGISVMKNFTGCLEEVWFNGMNIIRDALRQNIANSSAEQDQDWWLQLGYPAPSTQPWWGRATRLMDLHISNYAIIGKVLGECPSTGLDASVITFPGGEQSIRWDAGNGGPQLYVRLEFRTFNMDGTLFYQQKETHEKYIWVSISPKGRLRIKIEWLPEVRSIDYEITNPRDYDSRGYADGLWHSLSFSIQMNQVNVILDKVEYPTRVKFSRSLDLNKTTSIGGGRPHEHGFQGCMKQIRVDDIDVQYGKIAQTAVSSAIINGTCNIVDRCNPNPCNWQAPCTQTANEFICDCSLTGYVGAVCHQSINPTSCSEVALIYAQQTSKKNTTVDLDGSGVLPPIQVTCDFSDPGVVRTIVHHDVEDRVRVDGYDGPGSYRRKLNYEGASRAALTELTRRSVQCDQSIYYKCYNVRLLSLPAGGGTNFANKAYGWWVGRQGQPRFYWGNSVPGQDRCGCGVRGDCAGGSEFCNCDGNPKPPTEDQGLLTYKNDLPVMEVRFGDTGTIYDNKYSEFTVGPLRCTGDILFDNTVTFRKADASITLPPLYSETEFDLTFLFKTTIFDAVFMQNVDSTTQYYFEVRIRMGNTVRFAFNVGNGLQILEQVTANWLNDDRWHTVRIERNRKNSRLQVDDQESVVYQEPTDRAFQPFAFDTELYLGTTRANTDGFLGCITNLIINGVLQDIRGKVVRGEVTYGLTAGCKPKCSPNPCLNRGECYEYYSHYYCECGLTPYRGYICGREVGASFGKPMRVTITFPEGDDKLGTMEEYIQIGFKTKDKTGILMQMSGRNGDTPEYIIIKLNKNGGISIELDIGFKWQEIAISGEDIDMANNQHHTLVVWRTEMGKKWHIQVDDYEPVTKDFSDILSSDSDTRLDAPHTLYLGYNNTMKNTDGFKGCLYRAQWNNIFPLRMLFADPPNPNVKIEPPGDELMEDKCGYEEVMPEPDPVEIRPYPTIPPNITFPGPDFEPQSNTWIAIVVVLLIVFLVIIILLCCFFRNFTVKKGSYDTREAKGTEKLTSADLALKYSQSGQPNVGHTEYFM